MNFNLCITIKCTCFLLVLINVLCNSNGELKVTGRCAKLGIPPNAQLYNKSPERNRFENNETVYVKCLEKDIYLHPQKRVCKNGKWVGKQARCVKLLDAQALKFDVFNCDNIIAEKLFTQQLNQRDESSEGTPPNTYHSSRVSLNTTIYSSNYSCYLWKTILDKKVRISFLLIDIFTSTNATKSYPLVNPNVSKYRSCELQNTQKQAIESYDIFSYYYFCDLNSNDDYGKETTELSHIISIQIKSNITNEIGLDGIFMGKIYTTRVGKLEKPDCGEIERKSTGYELMREVGYYNFRCNDSFYDHWLNPGKWYKFTCNNNGVWVGDWPTCVPIVTCSKQAIIKNKSSTIIIVEIGNAYYLNSSEWFAINQTWVEYSCLNPDDIFVGKTKLMCEASGKWSAGRPYCTSASYVSALGIAGILFFVLILFIIIVVLVFRTYSRRVKRDLRQTKNEIEETNRKRISQEFYADIVETSGNFYDTQEKMTYDSITYAPRYEVENRLGNKTEPYYLDMRVSDIPIIKIN